MMTQDFLAQAYLNLYKQTREQETALRMHGISNDLEKLIRLRFPKQIGDQLTLIKHQLNKAEISTTRQNGYSEIRLTPNQFGGKYKKQQAARPVAVKPVVRTPKVTVPTQKEQESNAYRRFLEMDDNSIEQEFGSLLAIKEFCKNVLKIDTGNRQLKNTVNEMKLAIRQQYRLKSEEEE